MLLLPWKLEGSFLQEQVEDLLDVPGVVAVEPSRLPFGSLGRLPAPLANPLARFAAVSIPLPSNVRVLAIFHPFQFPLARALIRRCPGCELWFSRWDRYEAAFSEKYHADPRLRQRLLSLQREVRQKAALVFAASIKLVELEEEEGRGAPLVPLSADSFPAPDPDEIIIAASIGHLGRRTDWTLLRELAERLPELVIFLIGRCSDEENSADPDYSACRGLANFVWLGYRTDEEAARLISSADVAIVPYAVDPYNDAALPHRILKCARLGRYSICSNLAGASTWERAVVRADGSDAWVAALQTYRGTRVRPDAELRQWALAQTAHAYNEPLRERLGVLGLDVGR